MQTKRKAKRTASLLRLSNRFVYGGEVAAGILLGLATNPIPIKAAMKMLGRDTGDLRLPMTLLEAASEAKLRKSLAAYGVL